MSTYYPPYKSSNNNIKVKLDLTNDAIKTDLKNITHTDEVVKKTDFSADNYVTRTKFSTDTNALIIKLIKLIKKSLMYLD